MLRSIVFRNMINFKDKHILNFEDGVNFLIGANATGKSSILELIRRCHSDRLSSSVSNLHDSTQAGYIICKYVKCSAVLGGVTKDIEGIQRDVALLCYFQQKVDGLDTIYKCVCFRGENTKNEGELYIAVSEKNSKGLRSTYGLRKCNGGVFQEVLELYFKDLKVDSRNSKSDTELKLFEQIKSNWLGKKDKHISNCHTEDILDPLSRTFAFIFADRSFGPLQWINGNNVGELDAHQNYNEAQNRAKILLELLPIENRSKHENMQGDMERNVTDNCSAKGPKARKSIGFLNLCVVLFALLMYFMVELDVCSVLFFSCLLICVLSLALQGGHYGYLFPLGEAETKNDSNNIDEKQEETYFNLMTYPLRYQFIKSVTERKIKVERENDVREVEFVKAPEGVIEAKQASLVFSHRQFKTICYEDIDRGMHEQMIENLINLVLKKIQDKTIIIVTHNRSFMNRWAMERTYVCSRQYLDGNKNVDVVTSRKIPKGFKEHSEIKKALFAARVLLVEGTTDQHILQSLFEYVIYNEDFQNKLCILLKVEKPFIVQKICTTQIMAFGGKLMKNGKYFCEAINIPVFTLIDTDKGDEEVEADFRWKGDIEEVLMNDCLDEILQIYHKKDTDEEEIDDQKKLEETNRLKEKINETKMKLEDSKFKSEFKKKLKKKLKEKFNDQASIVFFSELFRKIQLEKMRKDLELYRFLRLFLQEKVTTDY